MKKIKFLFLAIQFAFASVAATAQISYSGGKISINGAPANSYYSLYAKDWGGMSYTCLTNNFLKFDLTPANPRIAGTGNEVVFYNSQTSTFNSIQVANVYNYSDARAKENIQPLSMGLNTILSLRPVSYSWKQNSAESIVTETSIAPSSKSSSTAYGPIEDEQTQYGFLAQEVENVIPDAVKTDEEGHKMINYTAIIPMLVQAIQEMQSTIEAQAQKIDMLSNGTLASMNISNSGSKIISCSPNPASGNVTITTKLQDGVSSGQLVISSMTGNREKTLVVSNVMPNVTENISSLNSGIHIVSLYVNGKLTDSQRLIIE